MEGKDKKLKDEIANVQEEGETKSFSDLGYENEEIMELDLKYQKVVNFINHMSCICNNKAKLEMYQQIVQQLTELSGYKDADKYAVEYKRLVEITKEEIKKEIYTRAQNLMKTAKSVEEYKLAGDEFRKIEGYLEADSMARECDQCCKRLEKKASIRKLSTVLVTVLCVIVIIIGASTSHAKYYLGNIYAVTHSYDSAIKMYKRLGDYKDCKKRLAQCQYQNGLKLEADSNYKDAEESFLAAGDYKDSEEKKVSMEKHIIINSEAGDIIKIGECKWRILKKLNDKALLMKNDSIKEMPYNDNFGDVTWEKSTLRHWLNSEFFYDTFTAVEQNNVILSNVENNDNSVYGTDGGNITQDYVFMLSIDEAEEYNSLFPTFKSNSWLRSPGYSQNCAAFLSANGLVMNYGYIATSQEIKVRPIIWFNIK